MENQRWAEKTLARFLYARWYTRYKLLLVGLEVKVLQTEVRTVGGSDLGNQMGDMELSALGWRFAALCR